MKKFLLLLSIFIILIFISSFSWASVDTSTAYLDFDLFVSDYNFGQVDVSILSQYYTQEQIDGLTYCYAICFPVAMFGNIQQIFFTDTPMYVDNGYVYNYPTILGTNNNCYVFQVSNGSLVYSGTQSHYETSLADFQVLSLFSNKQVYDDNTYVNEYDMTGYNFSYNADFYSAFIGGGGSGEEEEEDGFFANFWQNLIHIVVPNEEDWDEIQDSFNENILDRFNIQAWSFNDNLNVVYNEELGIFEPRYSSPVFDFGPWGTIRTDFFNDLLNRPLSLGFMPTHYDEAIGPTAIIETNGITARDLINFLLAIEVFISNILLYNKFFAKGE